MRPSMASRRAMITGITGQDGSYLAELLLEKDYEVFGMVRRASTETFERIEHLVDRVSLAQGDLLDPASLLAVLEETQPQEVYNLAAQSFVPTSWNQPVLTAEYTAVGVTRLLEAVRRVDPQIRFYQASSSEMFGTRKISDGVARIKRGLESELRLGDLEPRRDWGYAGDYVRAMWSMLQQDEPSDYVVATGEAHPIREFVDLASARAGLDPGDHVRVDERFLRPAEVDHLVGDASKARAELGWEPEVTFRELVELMVDADVERLARSAATGIAG